jgi:prolipoprotein diacylglyceryltransferase
MPLVQPLVSVPAVIQLAFNPIVTVGDWNVRLETLGVAAAIFVALVVAALVARQTPVDPATTRAARGGATPGDDKPDADRLRADDLLYIAVAAIPGAVVGGRIGYALTHLETFSVNPGAILDMSQGGLQLSLAVVGGCITASIVAAMLGAPLGRWMHALVLPVLLVLAGGKAAMILGGSGQGLPSADSWATAYVSPGPWGSLAPGLPSHPAQAYEALVTTLVILGVMTLLVLDVFRGRSGAAFLFAIGLWAVGRAIVATTWRDPEVLGPLRMDQVISILIAVVFFALAVVAGATGRERQRRRPTDAGVTSPDGGADPDWPDPGTRPRI